MKSMRFVHESKTAMLPGETGMMTMMTTPKKKAAADLTTHLSGYTRAAELDAALERFREGTLSAAGLDDVAKAARLGRWREQADLSYVAANDLTYGNGILDLACTFGVIPERCGGAGAPVTLERYFRMLRGRNRDGDANAVKPLERRGHAGTAYSVPELAADQRFRLAWDKVVTETREAVVAGFQPKPVLPGPVTFLASATVEGRHGDALKMLGTLLPVYRELLSGLKAAGAEWVEIAEPVLGTGEDEQVRWALETTWRELAKEEDRPQLMLSAPVTKARVLKWAMRLPSDGFHAEVHSGAEKALLAHFPADRILSLGLVNGRDIWRSDLEEMRGLVERFRQSRGDANLWVGASGPFSEAPFEVVADVETPESHRRSWYAGPREKIAEIRAIAVGAEPLDACAAAKSAMESRRHALGTALGSVHKRAASFRPRPSE